MSYKKLAIGLAAALMFTAAQADTSVSAMTFTDQSYSAANFDSTRGYAFSVTEPGLMATYLGVYDRDGDGLGESHEVGLWSASGTLLASATVDAGGGPLLQDQFRYVDIADVALPVGDYVVGARYRAGTPDSQAFNLVGLDMADGLQFTQSRFINNVSDLTMPTSTLSGGTSGFPGGSLMVASSVPEPSSLVLMGLGLGALVARGRQRSAA